MKHVKKDSVFPTNKHVITEKSIATTNASTLSTTPSTAEPAKRVVKRANDAKMESVRRPPPPAQWGKHIVKPNALLWHPINNIAEVVIRLAKQTKSVTMVHVKLVENALSGGTPET
jgi:hypothetical protein